MDKTIFQKTRPLFYKTSFIFACNEYFPSVSGLKKNLQKNPLLNKIFALIFEGECDLCGGRKKYILITVRGHWLVLRWDNGRRVCKNLLQIFNAKKRRQNVILLFFSSSDAH